MIQGSIETEGREKILSRFVIEEAKKIIGNFYASNVRSKLFANATVEPLPQILVIFLRILCEKMTALQVHYG